MIIEVKRTYYEMASPDELSPGRLESADVRIERVRECPASFYRFLYSEVGRLYHWVDRLGWTDQQIRLHLARPEISIWVMYRNGAPAGYFELERHADGSIELAYFGLFQESLRQGLGKHLLTIAVEEAWRLRANRVWLHTCSLDDPAAVPNYVRRGFRPFKEETYTTTIGKNETGAGESMPGP